MGVWGALHSWYLRKCSHMQRLSKMNNLFCNFGYLIRSRKLFQLCNGFNVLFCGFVFAIAITRTFLSGISIV